MKKLNWSTVAVVPIDGTTSHDYGSPLHKLWSERHWFVASAPSSQNDLDPVLHLALFGEQSECITHRDSLVKTNPDAWTLTGRFTVADEESFSLPTGDNIDMYGDESRLLYRYAEAIPCMIRELAAAGVENLIHFHEING